MQKKSRILTDVMMMLIIMKKPEFIIRLTMIISRISVLILQRVLQFHCMLINVGIRSQKCRKFSGSSTEQHTISTQQLIL